MDRNLRKILNLKQDLISNNINASNSRMIDGQISISKKFGESLSLIVKQGGKLWKTYLSSDGNQQVDKDLNVSGNINASGDIYGNQVYWFNHNYSSTETGKHYLGWEGLPRIQVSLFIKSL